MIFNKNYYPRESNRKLEKKNKRVEGRLALMERNVRENRRHSQKQKPDPGQDFSNLTLELQSQEERLAALQVQRDELLIGLKGLQESLKNQALRMTRLEGRLGEVLQFNGGGKSRGLWRSGEALNSHITPQEYYEPHRRSQSHRGRRPGRILDEHSQPRPEEIRSSQTASHSQATPQNRNPSEQSTPNQPKHSKAKKPRPQPESHPQIKVQHPNPKPQSTDYLPQPDPYRQQSQIQVRAQTRPYPIQQEQLQSRHTAPYPHAQIHPQVREQSQPPLYRQRQPGHPSWSQPQSQAPTHPEPTTERQSRTGWRAPHPQASDALPQPQSESYQPRSRGLDGGEEEESDTKVESSVIHDLLQLPVRQKIPSKPVPKRDATSK